MKIAPKILQALVTDASDISELIYSTSVTCCFTSEQPCPPWYKESVEANQIANLIKSEKMVWLLATQEKILVGVLAIESKRKVKYFFIHPTYQKQGIGKQLWHFALSMGLGNSFSVRSSLFAVSAYERLGFIAIDAPQIFNGMHYQNMEAKYENLSASIPTSPL